MLGDPEISSKMCWLYVCVCAYHLSKGVSFLIDIAVFSVLRLTLHMIFTVFVLIKFSNRVILLMINFLWSYTQKTCFEFFETYMVFS